MDKENYTTVCSEFKEVCLDPVALWTGSLQLQDVAFTLGRHKSQHLMLCSKLHLDSQLHVTLKTFKMCSTPCRTAHCRESLLYTWRTCSSSSCGRALKKNSHLVLQMSYRCGYTGFKNGGSYWTARSNVLPVDGTSGIHLWPNYV